MSSHGLESDEFGQKDRVEGGMPEQMIFRVGGFSLEIVFALALPW
jgi:hypothetical protein